MNLTISRKLNDLALSQLIKDAKEAEITRDLFTPQEIFKPIWENIEQDPDFSEYDDADSAELFRLSGYFISNYGRSKNIKLYQERAKNLLTNSIDLFAKLGLKDQANEAKVILSLCYFYEGAISESETILEQTAQEYEFDHLHPIYLRVCVNKFIILGWKSEYQRALEIVQEIEVPIEFCDDKRLIFLFHGEAGIVYRGAKKYQEAIYHYNKSIEIAYQLNRLVSVALTNNNLAFLYKELKNFEIAHYHIETAIQIFRDINQIGWLPNALDTKALIYFAENKFTESLQTIDEAIEILQNGEHFAVLIDSMWNKVRCYLALHQTEDAIFLFAQLAQLAKIHVGEVAVRKYTKLFTGILYVKQNDSLENEVQRFKKSEILNALRQTNYNIEETAIALGYAKTNKLIKVLNNEFPEIYEEIGIQNRTYQPKIKNIKKIESEVTENYTSTSLKLINQLYLRNVKLEFDSALNINQANSIKTFYLSPEKMLESFDIQYDAVLAVAPFKQTNTTEFVLIKKFSNNEFEIVKIKREGNLDISILMDKDVPLSFDEVEIIGKAVGYCSFEEADSDKLFFKPLPIS